MSAELNESVSEEQTHSGADAETSSEPPMMQRLMDLDLPLAVSLGRADLRIHEVLRLRSGSLIELDQSPGGYVELMVHGRVVARGEMVSVKGNYAVRIKQLISRQERMDLHGSA